MTFNILKTILWLKSGNIRELNFKPGKINLITGDSSTGKTDIINIILYCLFYDDVSISDSIVNENINWYGIQINVNDKLFTICRKRREDGHCSNDFFFSSTGEIPSFPITNNDKTNIESVIETEFSITKDTNIPFGGKLIQNKSKISLKYLLMFNYIDVSIIGNQNLYIAFQDKSRYKEALERVFDLVLGTETIENISAREKYKSIKESIAKLEKKQEIVHNKKKLFQEELQQIVNTIKSYGLIENDLELDVAIKQIKLLLENLSSNKIYTEKSQKDALESQLISIRYKIRNLLSFQDEYQKYQQTTNRTLESLKPIEYLREKDEELVKTSIYKEIFDAYRSQISNIKNIISDKSPIKNQIRSRQIELKKQEQEIVNALKKLPKENTEFDSNKERIYYLGQVKSKLDLYEDSEEAEDYSDSIDSLKQQLEKIYVVDLSSQKEISKSIIENSIKEYMKIVRNSLENYKDYIPYFDMKNKCLQFINPNSNRIESVGSSSNHMLMQLFFSLGIHELAFKNNSKFLAPFLMIDQLSRPYYGKNNEKTNLPSSDESKIKETFKLLNEFITQIHKENGSFQIIVLEHIPKEYVENLDNVYLVEEFFNGNALIPHSEYE